MVEIIGRGAEAILIKDGETLIKKRIPKGYRIKGLDELLRKKRTKAEASIILKVQRLGIKVPNILSRDETSINMEFIEGKLLRDYLEKFDDETLKNISYMIGKDIAKLHKAGIIHGDLTTSNMLLKNNEIYFIDFGLSNHSIKIEDKAVDLHLLKEALISKHNKIWEDFFKNIINAYMRESKEGDIILKRLEIIEKRGRYVNH